MTDPSFSAVLRAQANGPQRDAIAVRYNNAAISWRELDQRSDALAVQLLAENVRLGDPVAISLPNGIAHHEWTFAAWKAGATPYLLPTKLPGRELAELVALANPRVLVRPEKVLLGDVTVLPADMTPQFPGVSPPEDRVAANWKAICSGGSTGRPKLIVDHGEARFTAKIRGLIDYVGLPVGGVILSACPLYHNAGFIFSSLAFAAGTSVVGMERFDPEQCLALVEKHKVEWMFLVPTMMHRIWSLPAQVRGRYDLSSLTRIVHMASACPIWLKRAWIDWLGADRVFEGYGGTEGPGTMISGTEWLRKPGSVGRVPPDSITVRNAEGEICAPGEVGEIFFPPAAADRFHYIGGKQRLDAKGRMSLGDMGYMDADSYLFLADRRTDLIIRGGANIYPAEVESALSEHPSVASVVAIGLPCDEFGHRVHVLIEPFSGRVPDVAELDAFVRERLAVDKCPESYEFVAMPLRDDAGKSRRSALRNERVEWLAAGREFRIKVARAHASEPKSRGSIKKGEVE